MASSLASDRHPTPPANKSTARARRDIRASLLLFFFLFDIGRRRLRLDAHGAGFRVDLGRRIQVEDDPGPTRQERIGRAAGDLLRRKIARRARGETAPRGEVKVCSGAL